MKHATQNRSVRALFLALGVTALYFIPVHARAAEAAKSKVMFVTSGGTIAHLKNPDGSNSRMSYPMSWRISASAIRNRM